MRLTLSPAGMAIGTPTVARAAVGRRGRKPSPATQVLITAMQNDAAGGKTRSHAEYRAVLEEAGHKSASSAQFIVAREAKRILGRTLGRAGNKAKGKRGRKVGRQASPATTLLRHKLAADKAAGGLRDAPHYLRWVVDQPGVKLGLKQARPVVYRELRAARN